MSMSMSTPVTIAAKLRQTVDAEVAAVLEQVVAFRHERHAHPELTWQEAATAAAVAKSLRDIPGLTVSEGVGRYGVVALLEGEAPGSAAGPTIALRADMDALPVSETSGARYASKAAGIMHACGHDGHMANLYGSALVLARLRDQLRGRVKFIFQPAEEGGHGADVMCKAGVLKNPDVDVIFGLHGWPEQDCGRIFVRKGALLASTTELTIIVEGTGCHAAMPHLGTDQVLIAARIVEALQSVAARVVAPTEPVALTISKIHGGRAHNVMPPRVELGGTLRAVSEKTRDRCCAAIRQIVEHTATAHGATATVEFKFGYPPTVNHDEPTDYIEAVARAVLGDEAVVQLAQPSLGGEDFAYFLQEVPGSYFFLGVNDGRAGGYPSLHHPAYDFNDRALPHGIKIFVHAALAYARR